MSRALLKEAIADAKAVKEAAIANAKAALEEAFTPHLKELLASKLESLEEGEMETEGMGKSSKMKRAMDEYAEMQPDRDVDGDGDVDADDVKMMKEIDLDEILAELEGDDMNEGDDDMMYEAKNKESKDQKDDESEEKDSKKKGDDELVGEMTEDELKNLIMAVFDEMGVEAGPGDKGGMEDLESDVMAGEEAPAEDEEVDLAELMLEMEQESLMNEMQGGVELAGALQLLAGLVAGGITLAVAIEKVKAKFPKIKRLLDAMGSAAGGGSSKIEKTLGAKDQGDSTKMDEMKDELDEAYSTIKTLRSDLNEVNLLNAKLLYTNKIFKAKNLTESQKVKVLSTFDKASTVKEVKLVFESLSTSIAASNNTVKAPIKESMGFASKASGIVKKNQTIETDAVIARMKKLAGL